MSEHYTYSAGPVEGYMNTWQVLRTAENGEQKESLMRDRPADETAESVIKAAVERGSWG